jgi:hypothetical protein
MAALAGLVLGTAGLAAALVSGAPSQLALLAYVLFLGMLALSFTVGRLRARLRLAPPLVEQRPGAPADEVKQLETISRRLSVAQSSALELHGRLRPMVIEIASALLARRGVDLERQPERAHRLLGDGRAWDLVRPDRQLPQDRHADGWPRSDLEQLVEELERL